MQTLTIPMRCSKGGGAFTVTFVRQSPSGRFRIDTIDRPDPSQEMLALLAREHAPASATATSAAPDASGADDATHESSALDWTGWYCPHCHHGAIAGTHPRFVQCGGCRDLVCAWSVRDLGTGRLAFWCHEECGASGELGGGTIESYTGAAGHARAALPATPTRAALPPVTRGLLRR
jgi:hypothetical protein